MNEKDLIERLEFLHDHNWYCGVDRTVRNKYLTTYELKNNGTSHSISHYNYGKDVLILTTGHVHSYNLYTIETIILNVEAVIYQVENS